MAIPDYSFVSSLGLWVFVYDDDYAQPWTKEIWDIAALINRVHPGINPARSIEEYCLWHEEVALQRDLLPVGRRERVQTRFEVVEVPPPAPGTP